MITAATARKLARAFKEGDYSNDTESGLRALRNAGANQADSVRLIMHALGLNLKEADSIIIHSATWADMHDSTTELRDAFAECLSDKKNKNNENNTNESKGNSNSI